jgi:hypothetical protein
MIDELTKYVPAGKYTMAGVVVVDPQDPGAQRLPAVMAALIAAVSSVTPSPFAPKSLTFRKTWYPEGFELKAATPRWLMFSIQ